MLSVPGRSGAADQRPCAGRLLEAETGGRIFPVHRLDREVGGLLMFARNPEAHRHACKWFEDHLLQKTYEALVYPLVEDAVDVAALMTAGSKDWLTWEARLVRGKKRTFDAPHGKPAITRARCLGKKSMRGSSWDELFVAQGHIAEGGREAPNEGHLSAGLDATLPVCWQLEPVTGRPHQLRWEMARHGMPIVGDTLYGGVPLQSGDVIALRSVGIQFTANVDTGRFGLPHEGFHCGWDLGARNPGWDSR